MGARSVVITGCNFTGADTVRIGGVVASFVVNSQCTNYRYRSCGCGFGYVSVRTAYGSASLAGFVFIPHAAITSFTPAVAGVGMWLLSMVPTSRVQHPLVLAAFRRLRLLSSRYAHHGCSVASGASGDIAITTPNGTGSRSGFSFPGVPVITSFTPMARRVAIR